MDQQAMYNGLAILAGVLFAASHMRGARAALRRRILEGKEGHGLGLFFGVIQSIFFLAFLGWALGLLPGRSFGSAHTWPLALLCSGFATFSIAGLMLNIHLRRASLEDLNETVKRLWDACRKLPNTSVELEMADGAVTLRKDKTGHLVILFEGRELTLEHKRGSISCVEDPELAKTLPLIEAIKEQKQVLERLTDLVEQETLPWGIKTQSSIRKRVINHLGRRD